VLGLEAGPVLDRGQVDADVRLALVVGFGGDAQVLGVSALEDGPVRGLLLVEVDAEGPSVASSPSTRANHRASLSRSVMADHRSTMSVS